MLSLVSLRAMDRLLNLPWAVPACLEAWFWNVLARLPNRMSASPPLAMIPASCGSRALRALKLPLYALERASETVARSLPVPAEMSSARPSRSWASATFPVPRTSESSAGRSSSSATAAAMEVLVMKSSTDAIWASVAPVTFWRVVASFWAAASSSANALTASTATTVSPASAAAAGRAAFLMANDALAPAPSSFLKSLIALSIPAGFHSETMGREMAISASLLRGRPRG